jgi:hypothetical protein
LTLNVLKLSSRTEGMDPDKNPVALHCDAGYVDDCSGDGDCCPESWIGDGFVDCEDQTFGCDLTCYDNDGGDCGFVCGDGICDYEQYENENNCPEDCGTSGTCEACEFDYTSYGSECCDSAWYEYQIICEELEVTYGWDCSGCLCPGDVGLVCGDGACEEGETYNTCPEDCSDGPHECEEKYVFDCSGDGDCCPESWIGDGFEDCEDQAYGCDLTCYDNDGGDCGGRAERNKSEHIKLIKKHVNIREDRIIPGYFSYRDVRNDCPIIGPDVGCDGVCFSGMEYDECDVCGGDGSNCGLSGDLNSDGLINVLDVVVLVNIVLGYGEPVDAGDLNDDGLINVLDVVVLVNIILGGG